MRSPAPAAAMLALLTGFTGTGCDSGAPPPETPVAVEVFRCSEFLIGLETARCREDVTGPGVIEVVLQPDPRETSWEIGIRGLAALAEYCEFKGDFDETRLSALKGRGETTLTCPIDASVDRQFHEISFENRLSAVNTSIAVTVTFSR
jgi:hypothetical protein